MKNTGIDLTRIVDTLKTNLPKERKFIPLHEPLLIGNEWRYVKECLDTNWVSSVGKYVDLFEQKLSEFTGVKHAVAVVNGTAALHVSLELVGVTKGDEVLIPTFTFIATANAVSYCGAIPHFVDIDKNALGIDPKKLEIYLEENTEVRVDGCHNKNTGRRIKAIVPMHTFGHPVDMDLLVEVCQKYKLEIVEDAAESLGSYYKGCHTGSWGRVSILSFNGNKIITTGGGGAILTNDDSLAKRAKHITKTAKLPHKWAYNHDEIGYNYRLPNINAALGCAQLEQLPYYIQEKRKIAKNYMKSFENVPGIQFFTEPDYAKSNYWLNAILLEDKFEEQRDILLERTNEMGIMTRPAWTLIHKLKMYQECPKMDLSCAEKIEKRLINIPSSPNLGGLDEQT